MRGVEEFLGAVKKSAAVAETSTTPLVRGWRVRFATMAQAYKDIPLCGNGEPPACGEKCQGGPVSTIEGISSKHVSSTEPGRGFLSNLIWQGYCHRASA